MGSLDCWGVWIAWEFGLLGSLDWWGAWIAREFGLMGDLDVRHIEMCPVYTLALSKSRSLSKWQVRIGSRLIYCL